MTYLRDLLAVVGGIALVGGVLYLAFRFVLEYWWERHGFPGHAQDEEPASRIIREAIERREIEERARAAKARYFPKPGTPEDVEDSDDHMEY